MPNKIFPILFPVVIIGFILFSWGAQWIGPQTEEANPMQKEILTKITPILQELQRSNEERFRAHDRNRYGGDVQISIPYGTMLLVEYATDKGAGDVEAQQKQILSSFSKHLCRYSSFRNLKGTVKQLSDRYGNPIDVSITFTAYDKERTHRYWSVSIKPEYCK
jgi:hypothetical protein